MIELKLMNKGDRKSETISMVEDRFLKIETMCLLTDRAVGSRPLPPA